MKHAYPPDIEQFVQEALQTGEYGSEDDVVFAAVRALREIKRKHQALRNDVRAAIDEIEQGQGEPWDFEDLKARLTEELDSGPAVS
jgi:putative addiction module CopG family antidote